MVTRTDLNMNSKFGLNQSQDGSGGRHVAFCAKTGLGKKAQMATGLRLTWRSLCHRMVVDIGTGDSRSARGPGENWGLLFLLREYLKAPNPPRPTIKTVFYDIVSWQGSIRIDHVSSYRIGGQISELCSH